MEYDVQGIGGQCPLCRDTWKFMLKEVQGMDGIGRMVWEVGGVVVRE